MASSTHMAQRPVSSCVLHPWRARRDTPSLRARLPLAPIAHSNTKLITIRRGEGGEERRGGPLWSPASCSRCSPVGERDHTPQHRAAIKDFPTSTQPLSPLLIIRPPVSLPGFNHTVEWNLGNPGPLQQPCQDFLH